MAGAVEEAALRPAALSHGAKAAALRSARPRNGSPSVNGERTRDNVQRALIGELTAGGASRDEMRRYSDCRGEINTDAPLASSICLRVRHVSRKDLDIAFIILREKGREKWPHQKERQLDPPTGVC